MRYTLLLLIWFLLPFQSDDHDKQIEHCANTKDTPKAHKCECKKTAGSDGSGCDVEDKACKVYCRPKKCYCVHRGCTS